ncbi:hypothetical protein Hamer_G007171 [Homarus americanus]|uniref:Uncharacterized protein n=1 Tax=Homarus americanus TaxID=6706 RepID=A0A8J5JZC6_HOMAM|nr:hypothetical protein Hamer_G007171 [Homarus americanus]
MKIMLVFLLVAAAVALPTADPDPQVLLYGHPHTLTYSIKTIEAEKPVATLPITYTYPGLGYPYTYGLPYNYPLGYPYGYPYGLPLVPKPAEEPAVEEA